MTQLAATPCADFAAVDSQFTLVDDPDGRIANGLMALVYGNSATDFFFGLLNNTLPTSVPSSYAVPTLPQKVIDLSGGRLSYNNLSKQLGFAGVLDTPTLKALTTAIAVSTTDSTDNVAAGGAVVFTPAAMTNIYPASVLVIDSGAAQETVVVALTTATSFTTTTTQAHNGTATPIAIVSDPTLSTARQPCGRRPRGGRPVLCHLPRAPATLFGLCRLERSAADQRTALLANFLPSFTQRRKANRRSRRSPRPPEPIPASPRPCCRMHRSCTPRPKSIRPALADLTAIETPGLTASYFLTNNLAAPPDLTVDAVANLDFAPVTNPLPAGQAGSAIAATWSGYLSVPQDGFYNISIATDAGATVSLQIAGGAVTLAATGAVWTNQIPISLTAGAWRRSRSPSAVSNQASPSCGIARAWAGRSFPAIISIRRHL